MKQEYINKEWLLEMLEGRYNRNDAKDAIDVGHRAELKLLMDMLRGTKGLVLEEPAARQDGSTVGANDISDTFKFFNKLHDKACKNFQTAQKQGKVLEAENIQKKITHYGLALAALRIVNGGEQDEPLL